MKKEKLCAFLLAGTILATSLVPITANAAAWKKDSVGWWYQEDNGRYPANQWKSIGGQWYWFNGRGYMTTGWQYINGSWYYFQSSGAMLGKGWHVINGSWYYMYASGAMATNTWIGDSYVNATGAWVQGKTKNQATWLSSGGKWWYRHADGSYTKNGWEKINGSWYLFDKSGWMLTGWQYIGGNWYYMQSSGAMYDEGWHEIEGDWYYMYAGGAMATNTWIGDYYVNSSGIRIDASQGIYLLDIVKPYKTPKSYTECVTQSFTMGGKDYKNGFTSRRMGVQTNGGEVTYFNLEGKYKKISFIAGIVDGYNPPYDTTIGVIADGKEVANFKLNNGDLPISCEATINNCKQLQIAVYGPSGSGDYGLFGIAELKVKK